jgi:hypothetical protein
MEQCLHYFRAAILEPDTVPPWDAWWPAHADLVRASFKQPDYLKLKFRKLQAAREILARHGQLRPDNQLVPPGVYTQRELHEGLPAGEESDWIAFAEMQVASGRLRVCDAGFFDDLIPATTFDVPAGPYWCFARTMTYPNTRRVSRLRVVRGDAGTLGTRLGDVGVDNGLVGVYDPGLVTVTMRDLDRAEILRVTNEMNVREFGVVRFTPAGVMPLVVSGFGDGGYPIHELARDGQRVGLEVVFIGPEVLAPDPAAESGGPMR